MKPKGAVSHVLSKIAFWCSFLGIIILLIDFGFYEPWSIQYPINGFYFFILILGVVSTGLRYYTTENITKSPSLYFDIGSIVFTLVLFYIHFLHSPQHLNHPVLYNDNWIKFAIILTFIREVSELSFDYPQKFFNPAQLFILSFLGIIFFGTILLLLPNATYSGISFLDALFTSTSAVCVTGLIVVDTGSYFTQFGQGIILLLIQMGGLGILTFASYFSYFFKGASSYENQLMLSDITNSTRLNEVFTLIKNILMITFGIELLSAVLIYFNLDTTLFESGEDQIFFAIFHAISAFCNAGFSTLENSLYEPGFRFNYGLQTIIACTFIFGGLGFPIVANSLSYLRYKILNFVKRRSGVRMHNPWLLNLTSRVTLITTFILIVAGTAFFYFLEFHHTLQSHDQVGKIVTSFFGATTPRTAGFNSVNVANLTTPTIMITMLLMWVGASPSSTGGGIKTSTFAIATLNIFSLAKGKSRIEVFRREIAWVSIRRAFAIISLSLIVIGIGTALLSIFENDKNLLSLAFECFSAYSTVGLSLGITAGLSGASKLLLVIVMFVGRVGMLSVVIALFNKEKQKNYHYPKEEILIN